MAKSKPESDMNQDLKTKPEFSITDCPICLEQLRKPKSLPCLHTFCQDCLSTFITSHNVSEVTQVFFDCPVCRRKTFPVEPSSCRDLWASQFPTNNFVLEITKKINPYEKIKHLCHPCLKRINKESPASCWCQDCGQFQCENCNQGHDLILFDHKIIPMEELSQHGTLLMPVQSKCEKHGKNIELICLDHSLLCCHTCIAIDHRKCEDVATVIEYANNLKSKQKLMELTENIDKNISDIDTVVSEYRKKLDMVTEDKDTALQRLSDVRKWFDSQMSKISDEVMQAYKVEAENIQKTLDDMETVRSSLLQTKALSDITKEAGNEHQLVSTVLRGNSEMNRCEEIINNKKEENVRINLKLADEFEKLSEGKDNIGKVEVSTRQCKPLFGRTTKEVGSITVRGDGLIRGILVLPTGHLIVSDHSGQQLLYMTESGDVLSTLKIQGTPWQLCQMSDNDIAVTVYDTMKIVIVRLSSSRLSLVRTIRLSVNPYGIIFHEGSLKISTSDTRLCDVSDSGELLQLQQFAVYSCYLTGTKMEGRLIGSLFESNQTNPAVYSVSRDNTYTEIIKANVVRYAAGIDVDNEDNIYVCGYGSNNVMQISADGKNTSELLSQNVSTPFVIQVSKDKLYICENQSRIVRIFQLQ